MLAPQGVDPARDTVKFNDMVRGVTQAFAVELTPLLEERKLKVVNVLDQDPSRNTGQKLAIYSVRNANKFAVVLMLDREVLDGDQRLLLTAQHIIQEPVSKDGKMIGVQPVSVVRKSYLLFSSKTGANPNTIASLAQDFIEFLDREKRL